MSELKKELSESVITKKQIIGVIIVAIILVSAFTFSVYAMSLIFGTQRDEPSSELDKAEFEDVEPLEPHFPIVLDDLMDWLEDNLDNLDMEDLEALEDLGIDTSNIDADDLAALADLISEQDINDYIQEMLDGSIDDYDLTMAGLAIAALLFSDVEVFRVYEYDNSIEDREDILWKYECFDQFNRDGWESTVPMELTGFPTLEDYYDSFSIYDLIKIKRQLSAIIGSNSLVLGSLFPNPYIIEDSININEEDEEDSALDQTLLFSDDFGCVSADLLFNQAGTFDMLYNLFGLNLPSNDEINATAKSVNYNPSNPDFQKFLQLPGGLNDYLDNNPFFKTHWNKLNLTINSQDNAFMVANKIRNYLQSNFDLSFDALVNDPPGEGEDVVEWFCEHGEGLYSEFASAFVVFARSFGVASRFVDGFNSRLIQELFDDVENEWAYPIKYKNIYNWAEIYVPWDKTGLLGHGRWAQMDILYDSYGAGGNPITLEDFNLTVITNSSLYHRGQVANITAILSSSETNVDGKEITFRDITTTQVLGSDFTDINGIASILVNIDNNFIAGPNIIEASYQNVENYTYFVVDEKVGIILSYVSPQEVNISLDPTIRIRGFVGDYATSNPIENAEVNFVLFYKGTNNDVPNAFDPNTAITGSDGFFDIYIDVQDYVQYGEYELRADFNGSWVGFPPFPFINASSNKFYLNVTKELTYKLLLSINGQPTDYPADPDPATLINVKRSEQVNLSVIVIDEEDNSPAPDVLVEFYDYTNGDILIGTDISGINGNASILYIIGNTNKSGPTLVYARVGSVRNYSYYIVNESIAIEIQSYSNPLEIDLAGVGPTQFNVQCRLLDLYNNPIYNSQIEIRMNESIYDYTAYITPTNPILPTPIGSNTFNFDRSVISSTPINNYTLRLEFNGIFDFINYPYPYIFNIPYLSNSVQLWREFRVYDDNDVEIYLAVEGNPTRPLYDEFYKPEIYTRGETAHFNVTVIHKGGIPASGSNVSIWDEYSNQLLSIHYYDGGTGYVRFNISTNKFYYAGIHKIRVQFGDYPTINTTFIIINESVNVILNPIVKTDRTDNVIQRNNGGFIVSGSIVENGTGLRGLAVGVLLYDKSYSNVSQYLEGTPYGVTNSNGDFAIYVDSIDISCPKGEYYIQIAFNGSIYLSEVPGIDLIWNYMTGNASIFVKVNITAGTIINQINLYSDLEFIAPDSWIIGDILHVIGNLTLDNETIIANMYVNVTIQLSDGTIIAYNDTVQTDGSGEFHGLLTVDAKWPTSRSDTKIIVYFDSLVNNVKHVENTNKIFT